MIHDVFHVSWLKRLQVAGYQKVAQERNLELKDSESHDKVAKILLWCTKTISVRKSDKNTSSFEVATHERKLVGPSRRTWMIQTTYKEINSETSPKNKYRNIGVCFFLKGE